MGDIITTTVKYQRATKGATSAAATTQTFKVSNKSSKDSMTALVLDYGGSNPLTLAQTVKPKANVKVDLPGAGVNIQMTAFQLRWNYGGVTIPGQHQRANPGSYFVWVEASIKPDGSEEVYFSLQHKI
jgi:hypothetical protein